MGGVQADCQGAIRGLQHVRDRAQYAQFRQASPAVTREPSPPGNASVGITYWGRLQLAQRSDSYLNEIASRTR